MTIENSDFPSLFRAADSASLQAQRIYLRCISADLFLIVASGVAGALSLENHQQKFIAALASAIFMAGGLLLTLYIRGRQFEQNWFDGRAVAESVKTSTWRFMVGSEPYHQSLSEKEVIRLFTESLRKVVEDRRRFAAFLVNNSEENDSQIPSKMLEIRNLPLEEKKQLYLNERLHNQRLWYANKAKANVKFSNRWFNAIIISQGLALLSSYLLIKYPEFPILLPSVFATIAAAFVAWLQLKRHQELANSYGLAAQELSFIAEQIRLVESPEAFSAFVADAENAISREHTLWVARRDQI